MSDEVITFARQELIASCRFKKASQAKLYEQFATGNIDKGC